ncbi:MAG: GNAT family N-acetyltransferase [Alphaproteobacteria bacterium]|jgi:GNAT superfamily N-acetyltransferase|nr:GNAT family N-acetyltransferase [Alphaproteobacteria bacterium]
MNDSGKVDIIQARPDRGERAAQLIYATAPPLFDYLYGADAAFRTRIMALQWQAGEGFLSHCHAMTAYGPGGDLLGIELGFDNKAEGAAFAASAEFVTKHATAAQQQHIAKAMHGIAYMTPHTPDRNYCIHHLAVSDADQAKGLGRRLLEGAFQRAKAAGYKSVCLDVLANNPAVGFYSHVGMYLACEIRVPDLAEQHGFPPVYRMVRDL